ncbi:DUF86 domain-containing protein [Aquibacillus salsiterrae]|uniref:DUF86 domain-containing protein n=1 Tax=Aquibacillus salsiterrae TaxID=2950439 RepID=A0A9X3WGC6_9BACI|nr:DUF86 domain-containing protein [Aquibacillus salsiterrae]MDC3417870.1 DUF86 domain-containing protein [Aquibacillus salsiterrae]
MYFVDRKKIEKTLLFLEGLLQESENHTFNSFIEKLSLERMIHLSIEAILDVGNMMIDGFIMRDPGSFEDIIDILIDENVLPLSDADCYKAVIKLRNDLVKDYLQIDHDHLFSTFRDNKAVLENFSGRVRDYLSRETGVVTAFSGD